MPLERWTVQNGHAPRRYGDDGEVGVVRFFGRAVPAFGHRESPAGYARLKGDTMPVAVGGPTSAIGT